MLCRGIMRTRGTDTRMTEQHVCLIIDHTNERAILVGGRGEAETVVDMLLNYGNELEEFNYRRNKQYYKPLLHHGGTEEAGLGLPVVMYDTVLIWPNRARVDLRICKPGVHKSKEPGSRMFVPNDQDSMPSIRGAHIPDWFKARFNN